MVEKKICPPKKPLYNPNTGRCVLDNIKNRKLITNKPSKKTKKIQAKRVCPPKKPLYNPNTGRCVLDNIKNRKLITKKTQKIYKRISEATQKIQAKRVCPPKKPLYNPNTGRCVLDNIKNRKLVLGKLISTTRKTCDGKYNLYDSTKNRCVKDTTKNRVKLGLETENIKLLKKRIESEKHKPKPGSKDISWLKDIFQTHTNINNKTKINFLEKTINLDNKWIGVPILSSLGIIYLLTKHRDSCFILSDFVTPTLTWNKLGIEWKTSDVKFPGSTQYKLSNKVYYGKFTYPKSRLSFKKNIMNCKRKKKKYIIIFVGLESEIKNKTYGHSNVILYNIVNKEIEYFEPYGDSDSVNYVYHTKQLYIEIKETFDDNEIPYNNIYFPLNYCPIGPQVYDNHDEQKIQNRTFGYCCAWTLYYIDARLSNPGIEREKLISQFIERYKDESIYFINNYANFILNLFDDLFNTYPKLFDSFTKKTLTPREDHKLDTIISQRLIEILSLL
jgi:hypothetical protein